MLTIEKVLRATTKMLEGSETLIVGSRTESPASSRRVVIASTGARYGLLLYMAFGAVEKDFNAAGSALSRGAAFATDYMEGVSSGCAAAAHLGDFPLYCSILARCERSARVAQTMLSVGTDGRLPVDEIADLHSRLLAHFVLDDVESFSKLLETVSTKLYKRAWFQDDMRLYHEAWMAVLQRKQTEYDSAILMISARYQTRQHDSSDGALVYGFGENYRFTLDFMALATAKLAIARGMRHDFFASYLPRELM